MREAYDAELSSCGCWSGGRDEGVFSSYAYPEPGGYRERVLRAPEAVFDPDLGELVLPHRTVREAADPEATLLAFLRETCDAAAGLADWPVTAELPARVDSRP